MSFTSADGSAERGAEVQLFRFVQGATEWLATSSDIPWVFEGDTYAPLEIVRGAIEQGDRDRDGTVEISVPTDWALAAIFRSGTPEAAVDLTVFAFHREAPASVRVAFLGEVLAGEFADAHGTLTCASLQSLLKFQVPRGTMQKTQCVWTTYDPTTCKVPIAGYTFTGVVGAIDPALNQVTVTDLSTFDPPDSDVYTLTFLADFFKDGVLQAGGYKKAVIQQAGDVLTVLELPPGLGVGDPVSVVAGDDFSAHTCLYKFHNIARHMAHPRMPPVSPWYGQGLGT